MLFENVLHVAFNRMGGFILLKGVVGQLNTGFITALWSFVVIPVG